MEFDININSILRDVISTVDSRLQVCRRSGLSFPKARAQLFDIVNKMGEASARAQGLAGAITAGKRLETSDHHLYILKDPEGSRGQGAVIGILKMGRKRLFVYDRHGQQWEMNPLCVLDFYVHESRQRMGYGRRLFDFMLKTENMGPQHLAVDRPSLKFSSFLAKHYGLKTEIPQVNNFVIFEGFFTKRPDEDFIHNRRNADLVKPADYPVTGKGAREMPVSWQGNNYNNSGQTYNYPRSNTTLPASSSGHRGNMVAAGLPSVLPRHQTMQQDVRNFIKDLNLNPWSAQNVHTTGRHSPRGLMDMDSRSVSAGSGSSNRAANLLLQSTMYSRHQAMDSVPTKPQYTTAQRPPSTSKNNTSSGSAGQRPPSGAKNGVAKREKSPPLLPCEGPPRDYLDSFNLHHNYQGRAGHLVVSSDPSVGVTQPSAKATSSATTSVTQTGNGAPSVNPAPSKPVPDSSSSAYSHRGGYYTNPTLHANQDTSWTVFGMLRKQNYLNGRLSGHSRLW